MNIKKKESHQETAKAVYTVTIDFNHNFHSRSSASSKAYHEYDDAKEHFKPGGVYYFANENRVRVCSHYLINNQMQAT